MPQFFYPFKNLFEKFPITQENPPPYGEGSSSFTANKSPN